MSDLVGYYGPTWREGILSERRPDAEMGVPVVCSELVWINTEDGRIDGRCGQDVAANGMTCEAHTPEVGWDATCEHGMSLALCTGPMHY